MQLAQQLQLPLIDIAQHPTREAPQDYLLLLVVTPERLQLHQTIKRTQPIYVDFLAPAILYRLHRGGGRKQLLAKAIGIKGSYLPTVLDATAGFGQDAFILAALGCKVHMLERSLIIGALLQDGLLRLQSKSTTIVSLQPELQHTQHYCNSIQENKTKILPENLELSLSVCQSVDFINNLITIKHSAKQPTNQPTQLYQPDVIYLDPMYPHCDKKHSALNKEKMRILKMIVGPDNDSEEVFTLALACAKKRVVVKRPNYAPHLNTINSCIATPKPDIIFRGSSCRYDVYLIHTK